MLAVIRNVHSRGSELCVVSGFSRLPARDASSFLLLWLSGLSGEGCTNEDALMLQMVAINQHPESAALTGNDAV